MTTLVPAFIEKTSAANSHTFSAPSGIAGMSGLIVVCTGTSSGTGITLTAPGATVTELDDGQATNVRYAVYRVTGLNSGATVTVSIADDPNTLGIAQFYTDEHTFPSSITPGAIRSSSTTVTTTNSITPAAVGQRVLVVGVERTTSATTVSSVTSSDGETVTLLRYGEGTTGSMTSSIYLGRFDAANTTGHTATITYSNSSQNGYGVLIPLTAVASGGDGGDPGGGSGGGAGGSTLAPVIRASSALGMPSTASTANCPAPMGLQAGDYLIGVLISDADGTLASMSAAAFSTTHVAVAGSASNNTPCIEIYGKVAGSSDAAASSFAFSNTADSDTALILIAIQVGTYSTSSPVAAGTFTTQARTSVSAQSAPSMTGAVDQLLLAVFGADINDVPASSPFQEYPSSGPAGMTRVRSVRGGANWVLGGAYAQALISAGATGIRSVTPDNAGTQNGWAAGLIAVNPGSVTGGGGGGANTTGFFLGQ